ERRRRGRRDPGGRGSRRRAGGLRVRDRKWRPRGSPRSGGARRAPPPTFRRLTTGVLHAPPTPGDVLRLLLLLALGGCDAEEPVDTDPGPPPACGTANGRLTEDLVVLAWDDGAPATSLDEQSWGFTDYTGQSRVIAQEVA